MSFVQTLNSQEIDSRLARMREERLDPQGFAERLAQRALAGFNPEPQPQKPAPAYKLEPWEADDAWSRSLVATSATIAEAEPRPANGYEIAGRIKKLARFMARLDRFAGHQVTAAEVESASPAMIAAMLAGESRKPSDVTIAALADALLAREAR